MFVLKSTYQAEVSKRIKAERSLRIKVKEWNHLVDRINAKGGEAFLDSNLSQRTSSPLTKDDVSKMLSLCHPDRHDGKKSANEVTAKLLQIRKQL